MFIVCDAPVVWPTVIVPVDVAAPSVIALAVWPKVTAPIEQVIPALNVCKALNDCAV